MPEEKREQVATEVKGLSSEIFNVMEADLLHLQGKQNNNNRKDEIVVAPSESKTATCCQKDKTGTRETQSASLGKTEISSNNLKKGEGAKSELGVGLVHSTEETANHGGGKGLAETRSEKGEHLPCKEMGKIVETKLNRLTEIARENPKTKFTTLAYLLNEGFLLRCYGELKDRAAGVDGETLESYGNGIEEKLGKLVEKMKAKQYIPQPVRRIQIPKENGKTRPLGIPAVEDKIVQMGMKKILEAIYEVDFLAVSYGFRPKRNCHEALKAVDRAIMSKPVKYVVEVDVEGYFDNIDHKWLIESLNQRINDPRFQSLVVRFLKSGIMEEGKYKETEKGTPQGGVLSPILSNIYLHYVLDLWFEKKLKKELKGYAEEIRYADDFVFCVEKKEDAETIIARLKERLAKFGLKVSEAKTRVVEFGRGTGNHGTFDFLGITHYCDKTRVGAFKVGVRTSRNRFLRSAKAMNGWLKAVRNLVELKEWWKTLRAKLAGHYGYYGISGNFRSIKRYYNKTIYLVYKWVNRRSQKASFNWKEFQVYLKRYPLPKPKIYYKLYAYGEC
jgi:group II intron reverse transcriptase/maturase